MKIINFIAKTQSELAKINSHLLSINLFSHLNLFYRHSPIHFHCEPKLNFTSEDGGGEHYYYFNSINYYLNYCYLSFINKVPNAIIIKKTVKLSISHPIHLITIFPQLNLSCLL
jgi:hypothetical protein